MPQGNDKSFLQVDEAVSLLQATPATLRALLAGLPRDWVDFQEEPDAWSPRTVLVHFIHNERTNWIPRARVILSQGGDHKFAPFQQLPPAGEVEDVHIPSMIAEFAALRADNIKTLIALNLQPIDYSRTGEHPSLGLVTLGNLLATWVVHDLNHTHQILKSLAKRQITAVGPWRKYLGILDG